jgi:hypothetical protein
MPPRRRVVVVTECATTALAPLPLSVVLHIFSLLPVDCRLRCMEVCRAWRAVLLDRSLWTRLEVTVESGVRVRVSWRVRESRAFERLLRCAAARAGGGLQSLHIDTDHVRNAALRNVLTANAGTLRELHAHTRDNAHRGLNPAQAEALLIAAPRLRVLATDLHCTRKSGAVQALRRALRNEAPFGPLCVRCLRADLHDEDAAGVVAFAADVAAHASLKGMTLEGAPLNTATALDAVVDTALARRLETVRLLYCSLSPGSAPALARLLSSGALTTLECCSPYQLHDPVAGVLAAALRVNSTLTSLTLEQVGVFRDAAALAELLGALTGLTSLRMLSLRRNYVPPGEHATVGALLGALVAANAPTLTRLDVSGCDLRDDGLRALFEALPRNAHQGCERWRVRRPAAPVGWPRAGWLGGGELAAAGWLGGRWAAGRRRVCGLARAGRLAGWRGGGLAGRRRRGGGLVGWPRRWAGSDGLAEAGLRGGRPGGGIAHDHGLAGAAAAPRQHAPTGAQPARSAPSRGLARLACKARAALQLSTGHLRKIPRPGLGQPAAATQPARRRLAVSEPDGGPPALTALAPAHA